MGSDQTEITVAASASRMLHRPTPAAKIEDFEMLMWSLDKEEKCLITSRTSFKMLIFFLYTGQPIFHSRLWAWSLMDIVRKGHKQYLSTIWMDIVEPRQMDTTDYFDSFKHDGYLSTF